jgi:hypothetical protein
VEGAAVSDEVFHSLYGRGTVIREYERGLSVLVRFHSLTQPIIVDSKELRTAPTRRKLL